NTKPTLRSPTLRNSASSPSKRTSPRSGQSSPAMMRSSVVLPDPDGPSSASSSPDSMSRLTLSRAVKAPKRLVTSCSAISMTSLLCGAAFQHHFGDQRDQGQQRQQRGHGKRGHELVLVVEDLD